MMESEAFESRISGMICPECEDEVASALLHTRGVISAEVSYRRAAVRVEFDPELTDEAHIRAALTDTGYAFGGSGRDGVIADAAAVIAVAVLAVLLPRATALVSVPALTAGAGYGAVFVIGLLSGVHCIGMCGGIMLTQCGAPSSGERAGGAALYNLGRVISYTAMGALFGALGSAISYDRAFRSMLFTMCGLLVVLIGLRMWGVPLLRRISAALHPVLLHPSASACGALRQALTVGVLTGLMPCGAMSAVWLMSASAGGWARGAAYMLAFALGTAPAMLLFGSLGALIPKRYNKYILKISTVLIIALGLALMIKGLGMV